MELDHYGNPVDPNEYDGRVCATCVPLVANGDDSAWDNPADVPTLTEHLIIGADLGFCQPILSGCRVCGSKLGDNYHGVWVG